MNSFKSNCNTKSKNYQRFSGHDNSLGVESIYLFRLLLEKAWMNICENEKNGTAFFLGFGLEHAPHSTN
jgi:hypothetical protein